MKTLQELALEIITTFATDEGLGTLAQAETKHFPLIPKVGMVLGPSPGLPTGSLCCPVPRVVSCYLVL